MSNSTKRPFFQGLNSLRFFAATLVLLMHTHSSRGTLEFDVLPDLPILSKGFAAVSFFFVLSGFLITYLLLIEIKKTNTVNVQHFYIKRIYRIWPLYFLVVGGGFLFYWYLAPTLGLGFEIEYNKGLAVFLFTFFCANVMANLYHVGGMLHITWSISVEEQFYLFWAPLVKKFKKNIFPLLLMVWLSFGLLHVANILNLFGLSKNIQHLLHTFQFHNMAVGGMFAYFFFYHKDRIMKSILFTNKLVRIAGYSLIFCFYFLYSKDTTVEALIAFPIGALYAWLILDVSSNSTPLFSLRNKITESLGKISYGIYMLHMPIVYLTGYLLGKFELTTGYFSIFLQYALVLGLTIGTSYASFYLLETPFLKLSKNVRSFKDMWNSILKKEAVAT